MMPDPVFSASLPHDRHAPLRMVADRLKTDPGFAEALEAFTAADEERLYSAAALDYVSAPDVIVAEYPDRLTFTVEGDLAQMVRLTAQLNGVSVAKGVMVALALYVAVSTAKEGAALPQ